MLPIVLDSYELADKLGCCQKSVIKMARKGTIPSIRDERGRTMFSLRAVLSALREEPEGHERLRAVGAP